MALQLPGIFDRYHKKRYDTLKRLKELEVHRRLSQADVCEHTPLSPDTEAKQKPRVAGVGPIVTVHGDISNIKLSLQTEFNDDPLKSECQQAAELCLKKATMYYRIALVCKVVSALLAAISGPIATFDAGWGIGLGIAASFVTGLDAIFKWSDLREKYACLSNSFKRLRNSPNINELNELKLKAESAVIESDLAEDKKQ